MILLLPNANGVGRTFIHDNFITIFKLVTVGPLLLQISCYLCRANMVVILYLDIVAPVL